MQNQPMYTPPAGGPQPPVVARPRKKMTPSSWLFVAMVTMGVIILASVVTWIVLLGKVSSDNGKTQVAAYNVLEDKSSQPSLKAIQSQLGINVQYNQTELAGYAFADEITYSSSDLDQSRPYSVIRVRPVETSEATRNAITIDSPELRITTSQQQGFWDTLMKDKEYKDLSKIDALIKQTVAEHVVDRNTTADDTQAVTLGDTIQYKKVTFTHKESQYAVPTTSREDCYVTVQNDRPYVACINNVRPANFGSVPQLEAVLAKVTYNKPDTTALTSDKVADKSAMYEGKNDEKVSAEKTSETTTDTANAEASKQPEQAKVPSYLENSVDFAAVVKAVPSTVRVGTIYCADITLTLPDDSEGAHLTGACVNKSASGFFVSKDGLIASAASAVHVTSNEAVRAYIADAVNSDQVDDRLARILDYLMKARTIMESDAEALTAGLQQRDRDAIDKVNSLASLIPAENISIDKEEYKYAVQLSDKPIVVNQTSMDSLDFAYSDTVYNAKIEGSERSDDKSLEQIADGDSTAKDTALLRLEKQGTYPTLQLATTTNLGNGTTVDVVGMPMYAFGTLKDAQFRSTPLIRQGKVTQSFDVAAGLRLQAIDTPSHAGLEGAPALNAKGEVVGMATYDSANCPSDKCFGSMLLRGTTLIGSIAKQRNITLQPISSVSDVWDHAVDAYVKGNYASAEELFNKSAQLYPANYLAPKFAALAKSQVGSTTDTSVANSMVDVIKVILLLSIIVLILLIIARLFLKVFSKPHYETQYGQLAGGQYIDAKQWKPGGGYSAPPTQPPAYVPVQPQSPPQPASGQPVATAYPQPETFAPQQPVQQSEVYQPQVPAPPQPIAPASPQDQNNQVPPTQQ